MKLLILSLFTCSFLLSCEKSKPLSSRECSQLSMESFKGNPKSAYKLKKQCQNVSYKYTKEICQKALNDFIMSGSKQAIQKRYGPEIVTCLSKKDIDKFLIKN